MKFTFLLTKILVSAIQLVFALFYFLTPSFSNLHSGSCSNTICLEILLEGKSYKQSLSYFPTIHEVKIPYFTFFFSIYYELNVLCISLQFKGSYVFGVKCIFIFSCRFHLLNPQFHIDIM